MLEYYSGDEFLTVTIHLPVDARTRTDKLVIPRSAPGTYSLTDYSAFIEEVSATTGSGDVIEGEQGRGSYFTFNGKGQELVAIRYRVDIRRMETVLTGGYESSKLRENYLGILGYSVFGFPEGLADRSIDLEIRSSTTWPIFSTLYPKLEPPVERAAFGGCAIPSWPGRPDRRSGRSANSLIRCRLFGDGDRS